MMSLSLILSVVITKNSGVDNVIENMGLPYSLVYYSFFSVLLVFIQANFIKKYLPKLYEVCIGDEIFIDSENLNANQSKMLEGSCGVGVGDILTVKDLNIRINNLNERMGFIIWSVVASITIAVFVIIFAGRLTSLDASAVGSVDRLGAEITSLERKISEIEAERVRAAKNANTEVSKTNSERTSEDISFSSLQAKRIEKYEEFLKQYESLLKDAWEKEIKSEKGYGDDRYIVATAITRTGVVLVLVFLVQILIGLYRYNTRLVAFYQSRKDFISLWDRKVENISKFTELVTPSGVDFGKDPKHPLEDIINAVAARVPKGQKEEASGASSPATSPKGRASNAAQRKNLAEAEPS